MKITKPTFEEISGLTPTTRKPTFEDIINKSSLEDLYQPGLQMQGGYIPQTPQERPGPITRALKGLARKTVIDPIKAMETKSRGVGDSGTLLETIDLVKQFKKEQGRSPTYEEYNELSQYGKARSIQRTQETYQMYDVPPAETLAEKGVELATGVTSFITKLGLTKKILGGKGLASDVMSFEMVHEADGGTPGVGALLGYSLGAFGKMPAPTLARKGLRMAGQSATLAGFTAAAGGTPEDIAVAALLPPVMHTLRMFPAMMKGKMTDAKLANELGKRFPSMQDVPIKSRVKWARAMRDANKVKANEMTADAWGKKHGQNLYDFSEQAKTAFNGKGYDRLQLPGIAQEGFKESLMRTYPKISPKVADKAMQIYNTQGLQAAGTYVMGEIRQPEAIPAPERPAEAITPEKPPITPEKPVTEPVAKAEKYSDVRELCYDWTCDADAPDLIKIVSQALKTKPKTLVGLGSALEDAYNNQTISLSDAATKEFANTVKNPNFVADIDKTTGILAKPVAKKELITEEMQLRDAINRNMGDGINTLFKIWPTIGKELGISRNELADRGAAFVFDTISDVRKGLRAKGRMDVANKFNAVEAEHIRLAAKLDINQAKLLEIEAKPVAKAEPAKVDEAHYKKAGIYISAKAREIFTGPMKGGLWNARTMDATLIANKKNAKEAYMFLVKHGDQYASPLSEQEQKQWQNIKTRSAQILKEKITPEEALKETTKVEIKTMKSSPFYRNRVVIKYPSKRQIQVRELPLTESQAKANLGDKLYDKAKEKGFSLAPAESVSPVEGRIRIETFPDGLNRRGILAHAKGHIGLRYVRAASPKLFKKIQDWYAQRIKTGRSTRPMDEMFARAYAREAKSLRSNLPRDVIKAIDKLNHQDISDDIYQRIIDEWDSPDYSVTKKPEVPNVLMLQEVLKRLEGKALISKNQKLRPGARRLAKQFTGKTDLNKMTDDELAKFGQIINRLPEPTYNNKGQRVPPSIPKTTALTKKGEFEKEYREPTFLRIFHAPEYYAEKLGVKDLVEKAERGKIEFSMEYQLLSNKVAGWIKQIEKLGKTTLREKAKAKLKNIPTAALARFRNLLDTHEEPPESLKPKEKELFNNFRNLSRMLLARENDVRESLELEPIKYRKAYIRHVAQGLAKDMLEGRYPFPQGRKFWAEEIIAKKIYNTMEMQRKLEEDLEGIFTEDLGYATNSMLWTALKEIHLSQPIRYLEQQLSARGKDTPDYQNLSPSEKAGWDKIITIPSRTRRWVKDYVNTTIKGQQSWLDQDIEAIIKKTGLNGLINKFLAPFGRTLSYKPVANFVTSLGRAQILGVMGWRPKQIIRNKFQTLQGMALYPLYKETWRTYAPIRALRKNTPQLDRLLKKSLFLKAYTGTEEWPVDIKSKIAKAKLADFQWSAVTNARQAMETAYWGTLPLFTNPKFKHYGWADPKRTYKEKPEFLYPSEEKLMLKEMEFGAAATQHNYTPIGMPEIFRHKTLTPITRLQSWWMNHYFRFSEEAFRRAFTGRPTYSKEDGPSLPWKYRLGWLRYALIAIPILNAMRYQRSYLFGAAPTGVPPFAQFGLGLWNYVIGKGAGNEQQWKRGKKQMAQSGKTFIPGYMTYKDWEAIWSGRKDLESLFFYKKR